MNPLAPVFIVGAPRSGTTLTARILGGNSAVFKLGETHFFEEIWDGAGPGERLSPIQLEKMSLALFNSVGMHGLAATQSWINDTLSPDELIRGAAANGGTPASIYLTFIHQVARLTQSNYVCDDTPRHLFRLPVIFRSLPEARVVAVLRDPRGFMASYKYYWRTASPGSQARIRGMYHPILTLLYWRSAAQVVKHLPHDWSAEKFRVIRYEDLVQHPESVIRNLCHFLKIQYSQSMLKVAESNSSFEPGKDSIYRDSLERWRTKLTNEEVWLSQQLVSGVMNDFKYHIEHSNPNPLKLITLVVSVPLVFVRILWTNKNRTTSILSLLKDRIVGLIRP